MKENLQKLLVPKIEEEAGADVEKMLVEIKKEEIQNKYLLDNVLRILESVRKQDRIIGSGTRADVFNDIVYFDEEGEAAGQLCVKANTRTSGTSHLQNTLEKEAYMQAAAKHILDMSAEQGKEVVKIPKVVAYIEDKDDNHCLAMEAVKGKTLWRKIMEVGMENMGSLSERASITAKQKHNKPLSKLLDIQIENILIDMEGEEGLVGRLLASAGKTPFLTSQQAKKIHNSILELNEAGFYHRDLHLKNIMLDSDEQAYFIDFGTSLYNQNIGEEAAWDMGDDYIADKDINILSTVNELVLLSDEEKALREKKLSDKVIARGNKHLDKLGVGHNKAGFEDFLSKQNLKFYGYIDQLTNIKDYDTLVSLFSALSDYESQLYKTNNRVVNFIEDYVNDHFSEDKIKIQSLKKEVKLNKMNFKQKVLAKIPGGAL